MSDIKFISIDPVTRIASFVLESKKVSGIDLLIQMVIAALMTSPGSDLIDQDAGGGIEDLIGYNTDENDISEIQAEVTRRISRVQRELIQNQIGLNISAEEKLRNIEILYIRAGAEVGSVDVRIRVENELGRTRDVVI